MIRSIAKHGDMSQSDLDDLVQEIWLLLVRRLPKLSLDPARGTLHAWVAAVARHQASRHARRRSRRHQDVLDPELASALLDPTHGPVSELERKQQQLLVQAVIAEMGKHVPELQHRIIVEYWINEQSTPAIAKALQMSPECVWSTIRRARPALLIACGSRGSTSKTAKYQKNSIFLTGRGWVKVYISIEAVYKRSTRNHHLRQCTVDALHM